VTIAAPGGAGLLKVANSGVALGLGGGFDVKISRRLSFRTSVDYNPTYAGASTIDPRDWRDHLRISLGFVLHK
jgi:hypothetical protein